MAEAEPMTPWEYVIAGAKVSFWIFAMKKQPKWDAFCEFCPALVV